MKEEKENSTPRKSSRRIHIVIILVVVLALIVLAVLFVANNGDQTSKKKEQLTTYLKEMGSEFYTESFYKQLDEGRSKEELFELLKKYEDIGVKVSLDTLSRTASDKNKERIKDFTYDGSECNRDNTKAIVFPQPPFGMNDYRVETELDCGFEDKK